MNVRAATLEDLPGILDIYNDAVLNTTASYDYQPHTLEQRTTWWDEHVQDGYPIFVAVESAEDTAKHGDTKEPAGDRVVGWSSLSRYHAKIGYRFTAENSIYVAANRRGRGIGKRLMQPLLESARELQLRAIIAVIDAENAASIRLHERFAFAKAGHFRQIGFKFNRWLDVVYMQRLIE